LLANIMHFGRVLRAAGLPIGPARVLDAVNAVRAVGIADRDDFYWTLHAVFVNRSPHRELFDQAFHVFWRNPRLLERMMSMVLPSFDYPQENSQPALRRRLGDALQGGPAFAAGEQPPATEVELDAALSWSAREVLQNKDFEQMRRWPARSPPSRACACCSPRCRPAVTGATGWAPGSICAPVCALPCAPVPASFPWSGAAGTGGHHRW
jgi:uncharacterized protein with von Willebrand factor type A (vWA) domain